MFTDSHESPTSTAYRRTLSGQLVLKSVAAHDDIDRVADFNEAIHGDGVGPMTRHLILDHPDTEPRQWFYVEDEAQHKIAATLCLIPSTWQFQDVTLRAGELAIVGTDPAYRKQGLIRTLTAHHHAMLAEEGYDLSHIQGIPYFYRQFGYEYALPLEVHWKVELHAISDPAEPLHCRPATEADAPILTWLYNEAMRDLDLYAARTEAIWRYLLGPALNTGTAADCWVVLDENQQVKGYWRIERLGFGTGLNVCEASRFDPVSARAVIQHLKTIAIAREKPYVRFNLSDDSDLVHAAKGFDARLTSRYALQIFLPDPAALLMKMAPILARRLANSPYAGLTRSLVMSTFRTAWTLDFKAGQLRAVEPLNADSWGEFHLPPNLLPQLLLGHRTLAELEEIYPDVGSNVEISDLVAVLFPRTNAFIHNPY